MLLAGLISGLSLAFISILYGSLNMKKMTGFNSDFESGFKHHVNAAIGVFLGSTLALICGVIMLINFINR